LVNEIILYYDARSEKHQNECIYIYIYILSTLPTLLYGCGTWAIREGDKSGITSAEIKFVRRKEKYTKGRIIKRLKIFHQNLKLTQLKRKLKITGINDYDTFSEWPQTDCHI